MTEPMTPTTLAAEAAQALQGAVWVVFDDAPNMGGAPAYVSRHDPRPLPDRFEAVQYVRAAALTALSAENAALKAQVAEALAAADDAAEYARKSEAKVVELRQSRQAMHRRAQKAEGKSQRSAFLLETILRSIKEVIPALPTLPSPYPLSLHSLYHRVRAARDHARASSGRAFIEGWYYWSPKVEKLEAQVAELTRLNDTQAATITAYQDAAEAAEAKVAELTRERDDLEQTLITVCNQAAVTEAKLARLEGAIIWARDRIAVESGMTEAEAKRTADELLNVLRGQPSPASDYAPETWQSPTRAALTEGTPE